MLGMTNANIAKNGENQAKSSRKGVYFAYFLPIELKSILTTEYKKVSCGYAFDLNVSDDITNFDYRAFYSKNAPKIGNLLMKKGYSRKLKNTKTGKISESNFYPTFKNISIRFTKENEFDEIQSELREKENGVISKPDLISILDYRSHFKKYFGIYIEYEKHNANTDGYKAINEVLSEIFADMEVYRDISSNTAYLEIVQKTPAHWSSEDTFKGKTKSDVLTYLNANCVRTTEQVFSLLDNVTYALYKKEIKNFIEASELRFAYKLRSLVENNDRFGFCVTCCDVNYMANAGKTALVNEIMKLIFGNHLNGYSQKVNLSQIKESGNIELNQNTLALSIREFTGLNADRDILKGVFEKKGTSEMKRRYKNVDNLTIAVGFDSPYSFENLLDNVRTAYKDANEKTQAIEQFLRRLAVRFEIFKVFPNERKSLFRLCRYNEVTKTHDLATDANGNQLEFVIEFDKPLPSSYIDALGLRDIHERVRELFSVFE